VTTLARGRENAWTDPRLQTGICAGRGSIRLALRQDDDLVQAERLGLGDASCVLDPGTEGLADFASRTGTDVHPDVQGGAIVAGALTVIRGRGRHRWRSDSDGQCRGGNGRGDRTFHVRVSFSLGSHRLGRGTRRLGASHEAWEGMACKVASSILASASTRRFSRRGLLPRPRRRFVAVNHWRPVGFQPPASAQSMGSRSACRALESIPSRLLDLL
jgi:hypothetical protein